MSSSAKVGKALNVQRNLTNKAKRKKRDITGCLTETSTAIASACTTYQMLNGGSCHAPSTSTTLPDVLASPTRTKHRNHRNHNLLFRYRSSRTIARALSRLCSSVIQLSADFLHPFLSSAVCGRTCPGRGYHPCCHRGSEPFHSPHIPFLSQTKHFTLFGCWRVF